MKVLKVKSALYVYAPTVFTVNFFCCLVMEKMKIKVFACFYEKTVNLYVLLRKPEMMVKIKKKSLKRVSVLLFKITNSDAVSWKISRTSKFFSREIKKFRISRKY